MNEKWTEQQRNIKARAMNNFVSEIGEQWKHFFIIWLLASDLFDFKAAKIFNSSIATAFENN